MKTKENQMMRKPTYKKMKRAQRLIKTALVGLVAMTMLSPGVQACGGEPHALEKGMYCFDEKGGVWACAEEVPNIDGSPNLPGKEVGALWSVVCTCVSTTLASGGPDIDTGRN